MSYLYARWAEVDVITDAVFTCPARRIARAVAGSQSQPVYRYQFTHIYTVSALLAMRAFHGAELPFVFQSFGVLGILPTGGELGLSQAMQRYWAAHAASGQPAATGSPAWAAYVPAIDNALVLDTEITTTAGIKSKQCDFWDALSE